jgi:elongator complex protein 1
MRSLTPTALSIPFLPETQAGKVASLAVDPESSDLFLAVERLTDSGVEVNLLRIRGDSQDILATFESNSSVSVNLPENAHQVVDLHYLADERSLVVLLVGGDIATVQLEGPDGGVAPVSFGPLCGEMS